MPGDPFYRSPAWRRCRKAFVAAHPVCDVPGCGQPTTDVDHRQAIAAGGAPFAWSNLRGLCHAHHSQKTARQDRPSYRRSDRPLTVRGTDADGWPLDPGHR
ncbi:MAG: HNH endonuclease signature motif containing protein [Acetobacteraceae bacterium]